jgi:hypothetical protein
LVKIISILRPRSPSISLIFSFFTSGVVGLLSPSTIVLFFSSMRPNNFYSYYLSRSTCVSSTFSHIVAVILSTGTELILLAFIGMFGWHFGLIFGAGYPIGGGPNPNRSGEVPNEGGAPGGGGIPPGGGGSPDIGGGGGNTPDGGGGGGKRPLEGGGGGGKSPLKGGGGGSPLEGANGGGGKLPYGAEGGAGNPLGGGGGGGRPIEGSEGRPFDKDGSRDGTPPYGGGGGNGKLLRGGGGRRLVVSNPDVADVIDWYPKTPFGDIVLAIDVAVGGAVKIRLVLTPMVVAHPDFKELISLSSSSSRFLYIATVPSSSLLILIFSFISFFMNCVFSSTC